MKSICAYKKNGTIYIQAYSTTTVGIYELDGPVFIFNDHNTSSLGCRILDAFKECKQNIPHIIEFKDGPEHNPILKAAGVKKWNDMMKTSKSVGVYLENNSVSLMPSKFGGTKGSNKGYKNLREKEVISDLDPQNLGKSLLEAFDRCE